MLEAFCGIDSKQSTEADKLNPGLLLLASPLIVNIFTHIFNLTLLTDPIPILWKTAFVLPLHKNGSSDDLKNYRPISKLPCRAKVLEQLVNNQSRLFLSDHAILNVFQSGFRPGHSTVSAAPRVLHDIASAFDNKQDCAALFIDLTKAFDTVDHSRRIKRLNAIGFVVKSLNWFENDLTGRCQEVLADSYQSDLFVLARGFLNVLFWGLYYLHFLLIY